MREEIEEAKKEKSRAYHRQYSREYRARNLEKQREYDPHESAGIPGKEKGTGRRSTRTVKQNNRQPRGIFRLREVPLSRPGERSRLWQNRPPTVSSRPRGTGRPLLQSCFSITAAQKHSATSCSNWYLPTVRVYPRLTVKSREKQKSCDNSRPDESIPVRGGFYLKILIFPKSRAGENTRKMPLLRKQGAQKRRVYENRAYQAGKDHRYLV